MKNEGNMPYYFLCNCQSNNRNILAKFYENIENIPNLSQEIHKNTENVPSTPPSPPPQKSSKYPQGKGNTPHKVFQSDVHQSIIKNICPKFLKKPNDSQKIEKNTTGKTKQYSKMAWRRGGLTVKFFFQCSNDWRNTKKIFANFYEKQFNGSQKMEENHQNAVPK